MTASDPRARALADLRRAIAALAPHLHGQDDRASLSALQAAVDRLAPQPQTPTSGLHDFDPIRFQRLLDLAGPEMAGTLLTHLAEDLNACRTGIRSGAITHNWDALRESSHVLISLAGSVGALSLQTRAEALNAAAHARNGDTVAALVPHLAGELDALIALVQATPAPKATPAPRKGQA